MVCGFSERSNANRAPAVLLVGRPYHVDPEINHGMPEMIQSYRSGGALGGCGLSGLPVKDRNLNIVNQWSYHARLYHAASFAAEHEPHAHSAQLVRLRPRRYHDRTGQSDPRGASASIYTMIKLDEDLATSARPAFVCVRSWRRSRAESRSSSRGAETVIERPHFTAKNARKTHTILAPHDGPHPLCAAQAGHSTNYGYNVVVPADARQSMPSISACAM
jgi:hypothetical protein